MDQWLSLLNDNTEVAPLPIMVIPVTAYNHDKDTIRDIKRAQYPKLTQLAVQSNNACTGNWDTTEVSFEHFILW